MKKALITGANKGIGFATAKQLLQNGYYVFIGSRNLDNGKAALEQLKREGFENVEGIQLDVTDTASVEAARQETGSKTAVLDVLINNAGINGGFQQAALEASADAFQQVMDTNLYGAVRVTQAFIDLLRKSSSQELSMYHQADVHLHCIATPTGNIMRIKPPYILLQKQH